MKTTLNNNIQKAYIKNIKKQLKISSKYKRTLLNDLEINIDSYISEHPNTTYKDLVENFGTPEDVSESFYESLSSDEIKKQQKLKKHIIIIAIVVGLICVFSFIHYYQNLNKDLPSVATVIPTIVPVPTLLFSTL